MKRTDKDLVVKGIRRLVITAFLMFLGPTIIYQAFKNEDHPLYIPVLVVGLIVAATAILMGFRGIKTLMKALFDGS